MATYKINGLTEAYEWQAKFRGQSTTINMCYFKISSWGKTTIDLAML